MAATPSGQNQPPAPQEPAGYPAVPQYSASGRPSTRAERIAFQVWVIMFLLVIVFTLLNYVVSFLANRFGIL